MIKKDLGFVLRRHNFRETSLIITLYTSGFGKIQGILKGFYTSKKEFASPLEVGSLNELVFYPKKSEIWLISHVDLVSNYFFLRNDLAKARTGNIFLTLIDKTMQLWDRNLYIYALLGNCLEALENNQEGKILYIFLLKLLTVSGFKPEFNHCLSCQSLLKEEMLFSVSKGGLICKGCRHKAGDVQEISLQAARSILYIQNEDFPLACRLNISQACEEEISYILNQFLAYHLDFPLRTSLPAGRQAI